MRGFSCFLFFSLSKSGGWMDEEAADDTRQDKIDLLLFIFSLITISTAPLASLALRRSELMAPVARRMAAPPCLVATFQPSLHRCPPAPTATQPKSPETHVRCLPNRFVWEKDHRSAHAGKRGNARCFLFVCSNTFLSMLSRQVLAPTARPFPHFGHSAATASPATPVSSTPAQSSTLPSQSHVPSWQHVSVSAH